MFLNVKFCDRLFLFHDLVNYECPITAHIHTLPHTPTESPLSLEMDWILKPLGPCLVCCFHHSERPYLVLCCLLSVPA